MTILTYREKPITVEAMQFQYTQECMKELKEWMGYSFGRCHKDRHPHAKGELEVICDEFVQVATEGDYIIKDFQGKFHACKPDVFELVYEQV